MGPTTVLLYFIRISLNVSISTTEVTQPVVLLCPELYIDRSTFPSERAHDPIYAPFVSGNTDELRNYQSPHIQK